MARESKKFTNRLADLATGPGRASRLAKPCQGSQLPQLIGGSKSPESTAPGRAVLVARKDGQYRMRMQTSVKRRKQKRGPSRVVMPFSAAISVFVLLWVVPFLSGLAHAASPIGLSTGNTYYVAPEGDDTAPGSNDAPWATLEKASREAQPGDTIVLLPGVYAGVLKPERSGVAGAPITFRAADRRQALLVGTSGNDYAIEIKAVDHIRVKGLRVKPQSNHGRWLVVEDSTYIDIDDVRMEEAYGGLPVFINRSDQVKLRNSVFSGYYGHNMVRVSESRHVLVEGCSITRTGHSPMQFYPEGSNQYVVIRGNVFHPAWGRAFEHFSTKDILFEHNVVTNALHGGRSADARSKILFDRGIFRFNRVFRNWGGPIIASTYQPNLWFRNVRLYNNVFDDNSVNGIMLRSQATGITNIVFTGNIFSKNDRHGGNRQIALSGENQVEFLYNGIFGQGKGQRTVQLDEAHVALSALQEGWLGSSSAQVFRHNLDVAPRYVDGASYNHALQVGSPLRDAGAPLTTAVGTGMGTQLPVRDALYFYDGFGIEGEVGDLIAVGATQQLRRVLQVDPISQTLTLDKPVQWNDGDPVSFPWSGKAPDIGLYEHGESGRPSVQVEVIPFLAQPGEAVTLRAVVHGAVQPTAYRWWLGDGATATSAQVDHVYATPYDYPIRVEVTGADGRVYRGTGYVVVGEPAKRQALIHTTFDESDHDWWWIWYKGRGAMDWEREVDADGNGRMRISKPTEPGVTLPFYTYPANWQIDEFPWVTVRYRISLGVTLGIYLQAFESSGVTRRLLVAAASGSQVGSAPLTLVNDDQWHEISFDARRIRQVYPEVDTLEALGFQLIGSPSLQVGTGYWLDDVRVSRQPPGEFGDGSQLEWSNMPFWQMEDDLLPPVSVFGAAVKTDKISAEKGVWSYVSTTPAAFVDDSDRRQLEAGQEGYLQWDTLGLTGYTIVLYTESPAWQDLVQVLVDDGESWVPLASEVTEERDGHSSWRKVQISGVIDMPGARGFRFQMLPGKDTVIQVGKVSFTGVQVQMETP